MDPFCLIPGAPDKLTRELDQEISKALPLSIRCQDFFYYYCFLSRNLLRYWIPFDLCKWEPYMQPNSINFSVKATIRNDNINSNSKQGFNKLQMLFKTRNFSTPKFCYSPQKCIFIKIDLESNVFGARERGLKIYGIFQSWNCIFWLWHFPYAHATKEKKSVTYYIFKPFRFFSTPTTDF